MTHFTPDELVVHPSTPELDNTPGPGPRLYLMELVGCLLEPMRVKVGPLVVTSAYRSPAVNLAVGGAPDSAHLDGRAADVQPVDCTARAAYEFCARDVELPYDLIIYEQRGAGGKPWIHVQLPKKGRPPRRQALVFTPATAGRYLPWPATPAV